MANPNRAIANARRANNCEFMIFEKGVEVDAFEKIARDAGFTNIRVTTFRSGSYRSNGFSYRVSVYWKDDEAAPDMYAFFKASKID